jgi:hypothetical protein
LPNGAANGATERHGSSKWWARTAAPLVLAVAALVLALLSTFAPPPPGDARPEATPDWMWALLVLAIALVAAWALVQQTRALAASAARRRSLAQDVLSAQAALERAQRERLAALERISHDLRTPLASMQGYLELLLLRHGSLDAAEAQNYLQTAARHSERLSRLVDDLFELVRLQSEGAFVQREPFALAELVHDVVQRFSAAAERAQVRLAVRADEDRALFVDADVRLVERLLGNLLDNALRHTSAGGSVAIEVAGTAAAARITVADTGEGIEPAALEGIFERYDTMNRVGDTGSTTPGLGLAIARRVAELHGSALELQSTPGQGTSVAFQLPLADPMRRAPPR